MGIEQYDDVDLLEDVKHRGFKVSIKDYETIEIGGERFYVN